MTYAKAPKTIEQPHEDITECSEAVQKLDNSKRPKKLRRKIKYQETME